METNKMKLNLTGLDSNIINYLRQIIDEINNIENNLINKEIKNHISTDEFMSENSDLKLISQKTMATILNKINNKINYNYNLNLNYNNLYLPEGNLTNGKFVPSISGTYLVVALKTKNGNDPSATNPVYCLIGDTQRSITSALSVTIAHGADRFARSAMGYTGIECDFFTYLGYNATDGVVIGVSPFPGARVYSDFSATSTNDHYAEISIITHAAASDPYVVIGRFAATETTAAGPSYNWSVPTFTENNLIQHPIRETRFLNYNPTIAWTGSAAPTTVVIGSYFYKIIGYSMFVSNYLGYTNAGTADTAVSFTLPMSLKTSSNAYAVSGSITAGNATPNASIAYLTTTKIIITATSVAAKNAQAMTTYQV
jgi:hypothetical protein